VKRTILKVGIVLNFVLLFSMFGWLIADIATLPRPNERYLQAFVAHFFVLMVVYYATSWWNVKLDREEGIIQ
jgi:hypothetical protein